MNTTLASIVVGSALLASAASGCRSTSSSDGAKPTAPPSATTTATPTAPPPTAPTPNTATTATDPPSAGMGDESMRCPKILVDARRDGATPDRFVPATDAEISAIRRAMEALLANQRKAAQDEAAKVGFKVEDVPEMKGVVALVENGRARGGGAYLVRVGSTSPLVVQTPHTFFDEGTFPLGCDFFERSGARALFLNTVHRYKGAAKTARGEHPADVAHAPATLFQAATEGAVTALKTPTVIQLHGFAGREVASRAVVSTGERKGGSALTAEVARALAGAVGGDVLRYPEDTKELGATTNVQGALVRSRGGRFIHIEMSSDLRKELVRDEALRKKAFSAILGALGGGG
ncbi:MAG: hypothetical protein JNL38_18960 [Myxococcales bacterium]|jgi:hypothetical protein|nr:hypothetical protein [Myxococcales bacterium]